jgi:hypothetical protein
VKKVIVMAVLGIGGLAAAIALTVGALALAGNEVGSVVQPTLIPSESGSLASSPSGDDEPSASSSPSAEDHGGDADPDDNSGPGSDNSGSGSDDLDDD